MPTDELQCPRCGGEIHCLAGESAHPSNWYCTNQTGCGWQAWLMKVKYKHAGRIDPVDLSDTGRGALNSSLRRGTPLVARGSNSRDPEYVEKLEKALDAAIRWLSTISSADGSGHADLARRLREMTGR